MVASSGSGADWTTTAIAVNQVGSSGSRCQAIHQAWGMRRTHAGAVLALSITSSALTDLEVLGVYGTQAKPVNIKWQNKGRDRN